MTRQGLAVGVGSATAMTDNRRTVRRPSWAAAFALAAGAWPCLAAAAEPLRSIAEILALPQDELHAGRLVVVRGVVTLLDPLVVQDGDHGILLSSPTSPAGSEKPRPPRLDPPPEVGTEIEVSGFVDSGERTLAVAVQSSRFLGPRPLPEPAALDLARLFAGGFDGRRIKATGVVQAVLDNPEGWSLIVETASRHFRIVILKALAPSRPGHLIDADVEIVGVNTGMRNSRGEFVTPYMRVASLDDIRVVREPPLAAFDLPILPLGAIGRVRAGPTSGHRVRTTGVVSFAVPGSLYVQQPEAAGGVRVDLAPDPGTQQVFQAGDRVDIAGFLDMTSAIGSVAWAVARRISSGPAPAAIPIQPGRILRTNEASGRAWKLARPGNYDGCLIRCAGRIEAVHRSAAGTSLTLIEEGTAFTVTLAGEEQPPAAQFVPGSDVEITGIVRMLHGGDRVGDIFRGTTTPSHVEVLVSSADDVRVVRLPPWWTPQRLAVALMAAAALAMAAFFWVTILHREVVRQTSRAVAEESARVKSAVDYEITLRERSRLAANLHDTILQTVTGIAFQLKVCEAHRRRRDEIDGAAPAGGDEGVERTLMVARKMVDHAAEQLRGTVWSLRSLPTDGRSLAAALQELCDRLGDGHATRIGLRVDPRSDAAASHVAGNLLLVVQEAVHNALHHGAPGAIDVRVDADDAGVIDVEVSDDGSGFEVGTQAGPRQGHFGLAGMRERVDGLGGTLSIDTAPGRGTRVRVHVPGNASVGRSAAIVHA